MAKLTKSGLKKIVKECLVEILSEGLSSESVKKTGRLFVLDGGWGPCGISAEVIASVTENINPKYFKSQPRRITLPFTPAPTSKYLESKYYPSEEKVFKEILNIFENIL